MLTKRQNLIETVRGGSPDRYVNQYEAFKIVSKNPYTAHNPNPAYGAPPIVDAWGVTKVWQENTPGVFPIQDAEHVVIKDICDWKQYVNAPTVRYTDEEWEPFIKLAEEVDRKEYFATHFAAPGIFEQCHNLLNMQDCLMAFYEEPEAMQELIDYLVDWEMDYAEVVCKYLKPDAVLHHDDWGSQKSTFMSPQMFEEFLLPGYKKIYGYYKSHGVELIVHHSDSYAQTLVPDMIDMGIDIWQGTMSTNDIPAIIKEFGGKITLMGGIDSALIDRPGWDQDLARSVVENACRSYGTQFYIPCLTQGLPISTYPGVYEAVTKEIAEISNDMFH